MYVASLCVCVHAFVCVCVCVFECVLIFCAHVLIEKAIEHDTKTFLLFVDLRKVYDFVPREAMWLILIKYGVPVKLVNLIKSFHEDMQAEISVGDSVAQVVVSNGLRQG